MVEPSRVTESVPFWFHMLGRFGQDIGVAFPKFMRVLYGWPCWMVKKVKEKRTQFCCYNYKVEK